MATIKTACLKLCEQLFCTSSIVDKNILNYSVRFDNSDKTAEVILTTIEDEYTLVLILPEEVWSNNDPFSKCVSENQYELKCVKIKGFQAVEPGEIDPQHLKVILEDLAERHAKCLKECNKERNYDLVLDTSKDSFEDNLLTILHEINKERVDQNVLTEGIKTIEKKYETLLKSHEKYMFVDEIDFRNKLFVKYTENCQKDYKTLPVKTGRKVPLIYDLLLTIFYFTDQNTRQNQFHDLLDHYYQSLKKKSRLNFGMNEPFERQVHDLLPIVKLEILKQLCKQFVRHNDGSLERYKKLVWSTILEVNECVLYPNLSREDCYKVLKNKVGSSEYKFLNYKLICLEEREGFLGDYFKLKIEIERNGEVELLHFFAKYLPSYSDLAIELADKSFKKEEFYYLRFIPTLNDLGAGDITDFLSKCYFSRTQEVLIFDDMTTMNYKTSHVSVPYNYEMLSMTLKQLAKVHACSLIYEERLSEERQEIVRFDVEFPEYIEENNIVNTGESLMAKYFKCAIITVLDMLSVCPEIPKKISMEEFKRKAKLQLDLCFEKIKKSNEFRNVVSQGDAWASNIFFKTDKDQLPIDCKLVDFQLIRYCPPTQDIYFLLHMATTREIRKTLEAKLLQEYYSELSNILQRHKVDLQKIYTYQQYLDCGNYMRSQCVCHALMVLQFVLFPTEKLNTILQDKEESDRLFYENREIFIKELSCEGVYSQRIKGLIEDLCDICEADC